MQNHSQKVALQPTLGTMNVRGPGLLLAWGGIVLLMVSTLGCRQDLSYAETPPPANPGTVEVLHRVAEQRVDVLVGGELFTSYLYADSLSMLKKPVLYPIYTAGGTAVTRGYPLDARPGERVDHPHHIGLWFNYGNVNGLDFWNNSDAISAERAPHMGTIHHLEVTNTESGDGQGTLETAMEWLAPDGTALLREETRFVFRAAADWRAIDRITTLTALDQPVTFDDNKEGMLGLRVRRALEMPAARPIQVVGADGTVTEALDNEGVTGHYQNSEGVEGYPEVWGQRARWVTLSGVVDGEEVAITILDHPQNVGYPTYWHARDYGLFAANTLGQAAFSEGAETLGFALDPGASTTFQYRILFFSGHPSSDEVEAQYQAFAGASLQN